MRAIGLFAWWSWLSAWRSRVAWLVLLLAVAVVLSGGLAAAFSARQPLIVAVDVGFSGLRLALLFLILVWSQELIAKDIDRRNTYWVLSLPMSRAQYLFGRTLGMATMLAVATVILGALIFLLGQHAAWGYPDASGAYLDGRFVLVVTGFFLEALLVMAVVVFFMSVTTIPFLPLALGLAFSIAGRGLHSALNFLLFSSDAPVELQSGLLPILHAISWIIPDLSALDWRNAVLYGSPLAMEAVKTGLAIALGYFVMTLSLATLMFNNKKLDQ